MPSFVTLDEMLQRSQAENAALRSQNLYLRQSIERLQASTKPGYRWSPVQTEALWFATIDRLRTEITRLQKQLADMQAERWTPTIASEPGCDAGVEWEREGHEHGD